MAALVLASGCGGPQSIPVCQVPGSVGAQLGAEGVASEAWVDGPTRACAPTPTAEVEVRGPEGAVVEATTTIEVARRDSAQGETEVNSAKVRFTPSQPGKWTVTAHWSPGGQTTVEMLVAPLLPSQPTLTRRYVDRMDSCERGPYLTLTGLTLCQREHSPVSEVWVYGPDGSVLDHFDGRQLVVRGDEVWSWANPGGVGQLEHRTALIASLRFDGAAALSSSWTEGVTTANHAIRGEPGTIFEFVWNGTTLSRSALVTGSPFDRPVLIVERGTETWAGDGCLVAPGCTQTTCPAVVTCPGFWGWLITVDAQGLWGLGGEYDLWHLSVMPRPFSRTATPIQSQDFWSPPGWFATGSRAPFERLRVSTGTLDGSLLLPKVVDGAVRWEALRAPGQIVTLTDDWAVGIGPDVFTLLVTPLR